MKKFRVLVNGEAFVVEVEELGGATPAPAARPSTLPTAPVAAVPATQPAAPAPVPQPRAAAPNDGAGAVVAPMPGNINDVRVKVGDQVSAGSVLVVLEAMKMENEISAPAAGTVKQVYVQKGQTVNGGDILVIIR
ncbi:MAG: biotin/lipoyl-containing protein [Bacillota bacterium]|jgi:glutaconyl-CoA decarboxylase